jgi:hypothetical protein
MVENVDVEKETRKAFKKKRNTAVEETDQT